MWSTLLVIAQVVGCFVAEGILAYEPTAPTPDYTGREATNSNNKWQTILKSAMFRTLSKYTGFSPSLDVKMEADALLWEKLDGARYSRKLIKTEEGETLKTGALVDLSRENGYLEFRQVDGTLYTAVPRDHRLLALWRMRLIGPQNFLIQIKIPEEPPIEHVYEYSPISGLKERSLKDFEYSRSKQNKSGRWKSGQRKSYSASGEVYTGRSLNPKSQNHYVVRSHQYNGNRYKLPQQNHRPGKAPRTYLHKPTTQYYTVVEYQTPPPPPAVPKYPSWKQENDYYQANQIKGFAEFKQETDYDGFVPSIGPRGTPSLYQENSNEAATYSKQPVTYYPPYTPEVTPTQKPYPVTYFKPSTQFIQYSEIDPFYNTNDTYYSPLATLGIPLLTENIPQYQQIIYNAQQTPAISVQIPNVEPGLSLYDIALNAIKNESLSETPAENTVQPTVTTPIYEYTSINDSLKTTYQTTETLPQTTIEILKPTITEISQTKTRVKNSLRNPQRTSNSGGDSHDYAPLYIQWGEKLKTTDKIRNSTQRNKNSENIDKNRLSTTTERSTTRENIVQSTTTTSRNILPVNEEAPKKPSERLQELQRRRQSLKAQKNKLPEAQPTLSTKQINELSRNFDNGTNVIITNITTKSPEEVVRDLTTMGLQNSTNAEISENLRNENAKILARDNQKKRNDARTESSDPVSVVVNRISQSVSIKISEGEKNDSTPSEKT